MHIVKVLNNNAVHAQNQQIEYILMGKGIGFQKKTGVEVDMDKVEKTFVLQGDQIAILNDISHHIASEETDVIVKIIDLAEKTLNVEFYTNLFVTLTDHLHFAYQRVREDTPIRNPLAWEVRKFYQKEYSIGKQALEIIEQDVGIRLPEDEAAAIALHLVNAQKEGGLMEETVKMVTIVQDILNIVQIHFQTTFDENSISYNRFITHLQYFAQRIINGELPNSGDTFLYEQVQRNYPEAYQCSLRIKKYVENNYKFELSIDELVYLTIHIKRITAK